MAPTYCVVKMFHRAAYERLRRTLGDDEDSQSAPEVSPPTKLIKSHFSEALLCRICLQQGTIPIYTEDTSETVADDIRIFGDIVVRRDDIFPKYLCENCNELLQSAILFRKTAKESLKILKESVLMDVKEPLPNVKEIVALKQVKHQEKMKKVRMNQTLLQKYFLPVENSYCYNSENGDITWKVENEEKDFQTATKVRCLMCHKVVAKSYYKDHFTIHEKNPPKYICDVCGKSFRLRTTYKTHLYTHSSNFPYKCKYCPYMGRHAGLLKTHMRTHVRDYKYQCPECPAKFLYNCNLHRHRLRHRLPMYECDECKRMFHSKLLVTRHHEVEHMGIRNYICDICGKPFGYRKAMMRHQLKVHKREKKASGRTPSYLLEQYRTQMEQTQQTTQYQIDNSIY